MQVRNVVHLVVAMAIGIFTSSCAYHLGTYRLYDGAAKDDNLVARIVIPHPAEIMEIDGQQLKKAASRYTVVELLPGEHQIMFRYKEVFPHYGGATTKTSPPTNLRFEAEAGKVYFVSTSSSGEKVKQDLLGPFPMSVKIEGTGRSVSLGQSPVKGPNEKRDNFSYIVKDGANTKAYPAFLVLNQLPSFSEDDKHIAFWVYHASDDRQWVIDGVEQPHHFSLLNGRVKFNKDGTRHAYAAQKGETNYLVIDGEPLKLGQDRVHIGNLSFSPEGKGIAYSRRSPDEKSSIIWNDQTLGPYDKAFSPYFSPKNGTMYYFGLLGKEWRLYVNGTAERIAFEQEPLPYILLDEDEKHLAYVISEGQKYSVILDGQRDILYDNLSMPVFSPDGNQLAYIAKDENLKKYHVVVNSKVMATHDEIDLSSLSFGEDSTALFVKIKKNDNWVTKEVEIVQQEETSQPAATTAAAPVPQEPPAVQ